MKLFNFVVAFLLIAGVGHAASLADLQQQAVENRKIIKKYEANLESNKDDLGLAWSKVYPSLDLSYNVNALDESSVTENRANSVAVGAISWNLFAGLQDRYKIKSSQLIKKAGEFKLQGIRQDIRLNVSLRYLNIYIQKASLQVAEDSHATLQKVYKDAENRFHVGLIKKNELLRFKVDLDNAEITRKKAHAGMDKSVRLLQREIDAAVHPEQLLFSEFEKMPTLRESGSYEEEMLRNRSEILALQEMERAAEADVKAAYGSISPRVDIVGSYRKYNDEFGTSGDITDEELRTQLTLSMNIFDGFGKYRKVGKAKRAHDALRYDLAEMKCDLKAQLANLILDYTVSSENVTVAQSSIEQAKENLRITRMSYKEGLEKESDLLDAITNLSRAKYNYVAAKGEVFANYFKITRAVEGF